MELFSIKKVIIPFQQSTFRRFAAKYYHLFLLKMVSVDICCFRGIILSLTTVVKLPWNFLTLISDNVAPCHGICCVVIFPATVYYVGRRFLSLRLSSVSFVYFEIQQATPQRTGGSHQAGIDQNCKAIFGAYTTIIGNYS